MYEAPGAEFAQGLFAEKGEVIIGADIKISAQNCRVYAGGITAQSGGAVSAPSVAVSGAVSGSFSSGGSLSVREIAAPLVDNLP